MAEPQAEPFSVALTWLREHLQQGLLRPGARITAVDLADDLGLSTTPVREALSRVAGEDLVEDRRGQGYFVRPLSAADIADLYRLSLAKLLIALEPRRPARGQADPRQGDPRRETADGPPNLPDPVLDVERLFRGWVAATGSRSLIRAFRVVQIQLGPVRRLESEVLGDLAGESAVLCAASELPRGEKLALLRQFHAARIREAERLAARLEAAAAGPQK